MTDVYARLARYLDQLPAGYPPTASGVELKILRALFSPAEAELVLHLTLLDEEARVVAFRARRPVKEVAAMLADLARRGLISAADHPGRPPTYMVSQFVLGFWEGQVNKLTRELVELVEEYWPQYARSSPWVEQMPQMRTIPVGVSIPITTEVLPYESIEEILRRTDDFAVQNCICRQELDLLGKRCHNPLESCLILGPFAVGAVEAGGARRLTREEAREVLRQAEKDGRVLQPANAQDPMFLCTCCPCCCGVLRLLKLQERPADLVANAFHARHDPSTCADCGACVERCPMDALTQAGGALTHRPERCIGCGLCISACPTGSLTMVRKPAGECPSIPRSLTETYLRLGQQRDKLFIAKMAGVLVKSKIDRAIAPR